MTFESRMQPPKPLSPHLQIYRLPLTAVLSILHRITGVFLAWGLVVLTIWLVSAAVDRDFYERITVIFSGWAGQVLLLCSISALYLHLANGIRHLFWDAGYGFELKTVDWSAVLAIVFTLLATIASWLLILQTRGLL